MKKAILQVADTSPLESLVIMLRSVGYQCYTLSSRLCRELRSIGCDTVLEISDLVRGMGYERPVSLPLADVEDMTSADLYVDVKAHRSYPKVVSRWPNLKNRVLWYRINGGIPEHVIKSNGEDCGDEANPPCPILTPNQWYKGRCEIPDIGNTDRRFIPTRCLDDLHKWSPTLPHGSDCKCVIMKDSKSYACWPPFYRFHEYRSREWGTPTHVGGLSKPVCLIHNLKGWGYSSLVPELSKLGVRFFGSGSPNGLVPHADVKHMLSNTLCMVHLKSSDAPGYALYEALATGCPIICSRRLIWKEKMQELLIPDITCLVFDVIGHQGLSAEDEANCVTEIKGNLEQLKDPTFNRWIGTNGQERLKKLMWSDSKKEDVDSLREFVRRNFG